MNKAILITVASILFVGANENPAYADEFDKLIKAAVVITVAEQECGVVLSDAISSEMDEFDRMLGNDAETTRIIINAGVAINAKLTSDKNGTCTVLKGLVANAEMAIKGNAK